MSKEDEKPSGISMGILTNTRTIKKKLEELEEKNELYHKELLQMFLTFQEQLDNKTRGDT